VSLGIFYVITSWAAISGYDSMDQAASSAYNDPLNFFFIPAVRFGNETLRDVMSYLIITGAFACGMAFHNTTARYFYSLGRERLLPAALGRTHEKHKSPYIASTTQSVIAALIVIAFAVRAAVNPDQGAAYSVAYLQVYGLMAFMGVVSILAIQGLVSVAIWNYFRTHHPSEHRLWNHTLAPLISVVGQGVVLYLAIKNIDFLGSGYSYAKWLVVIDALIFVAGIGAALYLKSANRAKYETIGRLINEGL
jgi:amino acid transporter